MRNNLVRGTLLLFIVSALAVGLILAQMPGGPRGQMGPGPDRPDSVQALRGPDGPAPLQVIARYLKLTEDQVEGIRELLSSTRDEIASLHETIATLQEELGQALETDPPDATTVGTKVIAIRDVRQQIRDLESSIVDAIVALLDAQQLEKLEQVQQAAGLQPVVDAFRVLHLVAPGRPAGPPPGD